MNRAATARHSESAGPTAVAQTPDYAGRGHALRLLVLIGAIYAVDKISIAVVIEPIGREFGLGDAQRALLSGMAYGIAFAVSSIPIGMLIDRFPRKHVLAALLTVWSSFTVICGLAVSYPMLLASRLLVGGAESGALPASMSLVADLAPPSRRASIVALLYAGTGVGASLAALGGAALAQHFGWRASFFMAGVPGLILAIVFAATVREPQRGSLDTVLRTRSATRLSFTARYFISQPVLIHTFIAATCSATAVAAMNSWCVAFFIRLHHVTLSLAGLIFASAIGPGVIVGSLMGGVIGDCLSRRTPAGRIWFAAATAAAGVPMAWFGLTVPGLAASAAGVGGLTVLASVFFAPAAATVVNFTLPEMRGVVLSAKEILANLIGLGTGPLFAGGLSDLYGGAESLRPALLTVVTVCLLISALNFCLAARSIRHRPVDHSVLRWR